MVASTHTCASVHHLGSIKDVRPRWGVPSLGGGHVGRRREGTTARGDGGVGGQQGGVRRRRREQRGGEALMGGRPSRWARPRRGADVAVGGDRCRCGIHRGGVRGRPSDGTAGPAIAG